MDERSDKGDIRNEQQEWRKRPRKLQKNDSICKANVIRMREEHIVRNMLDVDTPGKTRRGRPNLR